MLGAHPEVDAAEERLAEALESPAPGVTAAAAGVVAQHPERAFAKRAAAGEGKGRLNEAVMTALGRAWPSDEAGEVLGAVAEAAGALGLLAARPRLDAMCQSPSAWLRERAGRGLSWLAGTTVACGLAKPGPPADELGRLATTRRTIALTVGPSAVQVHLDPSTAPVATTRIAELFRAGFYDGLAVHRIVPGLLVQFGDRGGDGFGGAGDGRAPLRLEASPGDLDPGDLAVATSGPDTGSSQLFVALSRQPFWDGEYSVIGKAQGDWARVAEGDLVLRTATVPE